MQQGRICFVVLLLQGFTISTVAADINSPFKSSNRNPFIQIYGLPAAQDALLVPVGNSEWTVEYEVASNFTFDGALSEEPSSEPVIIDGETDRTTLEWRHGFSEKTTLTIDVPVVRHHGGSLDSFINTWHSTFNLPDGGREDFPEDQLIYSYQGNGESFALTENQSGLGDIDLSGNFLLSSSVSRQTSLRAGIKLPTGDEDKFLGSGSTNLYLGLNTSTLDASPWTWHASGGLLWISGGDVLDGIREDWVAFGSSTISWAYNQSLSFKAQLDVHSAFYDSGTTELGSNSAQFVFGAGARVSKNWLLDLSISEDIAVDTAPDVVFGIGLTYTAY